MDEPIKDDEERDPEFGEGSIIDDEEEGEVDVEETGFEHKKDDEEDFSGEDESSLDRLIDEEMDEGEDDYDDKDEL
jgi:hypothetical protein